MNHLFIINPRSFATSEELADALAEINKHFSSVTNAKVTIHISRYPRDAVCVIQSFMKKMEGEIRVYAIGGNGTLFDCLNGIRGNENAELASVSIGYSSDFVRGFGNENLSLFGKIDLQVSGKSHLTDVLDIGSNIAINACQVGVSTYAISHSAEIIKKHNITNKFLVKLIKRWTILATILLGDQADQEYKITVDEMAYDGVYATIYIANGPCDADNKTPAPGALPNDGQFDVFLIKNAKRFRMVKIFNKFLQGKYLNFPNEITRLNGKKINISSEMPLLIAADGECFYDTKFSAEIIHNHIKFVTVNDLTYGQS